LENKFNNYNALLDENEILRNEIGVLKNQLKLSNYINFYANIFLNEFPSLIILLENNTDPKVKCNFIPNDWLINSTDDISFNFFHEVCIQRNVNFYSVNHNKINMEELLKESLKGEIYKDLSLEIRSESIGVSKYIKGNIKPFYKDAELEGSIGIFKEISHDEFINNEKVSFQNIKRLMEYFPLGVILTDKTGKIIEANKYALKYLNITEIKENELTINTDKWKVIRKDGTVMKPDEFASVRSLKENRIIENMDMGVIKSNNEILWLRTSSSPLNIENLGVLITMSDITETVKAEKFVKESEDKFYKIFHLNPGAIIISEFSSGKFIEVNDKFLELTKFRREEIIDKRAEEINFAKILEIDRIQEVLDLGLNRNIEENYCTRLGEERIGLFSFTRILISGKEALLTVLTDITTRKKNEEELRHSLETKDKLFSIVSHDLRSPFQGLLGFSELLLTEDENLSAEARGVISRNIYNSVKKTYDLLENLLNWSRLQIGKIKYKPRKIEISGLIYNVISVMSSNAEAKNIVINYHGEDELIVHCDDDMTRSVLQNLISNAIKFSYKGGNIDTGESTLCFIFN